MSMRVPFPVAGTRMFRLLCALGVLVLSSCSDAPTTISERQVSSDPSNLTTLGPLGSLSASAGPVGAAAVQLSAAVAGSHVRVVGGTSLPASELVPLLTGLGATVTRAGTLPVDLSPYDVLWSVFGLFSEADRGRLAQFLAAGGGVHLTGERPICCDIFNANVQAVLDAVVAAGGVQVGRLGEFAFGTFLFKPEAVGGLTATPNLLTT